MNRALCQTPIVSEHKRSATVFPASARAASARSGRLALSSVPPASRQARRAVQRVWAAATEPTTSTSNAGEPVFYEVTLPKPLGLRYARGRDGSAYVIQCDARLGNIDEEIQVGDRVAYVSASFGPDVWEARNYGQVMYAIKTRNGDVYLKLEKKYGDMSILEEEVLTDAEKAWRTERAGGNYGAGTREIQQRNYIAKKEEERKRRELFDDALQKFRAGKTEEALVDWENVVSLEPQNYIGDDFSRVSRIYITSQYNIACCYSVMNQMDAGLEALEEALKWGFESYDQIRSDQNLANLRASPKFKPMINKYDEPIINENALKAIRGLFSFGNKDQ